MKVRLNRLPAGYREVEYLESTNLEYINTTKTVDSTCVISFEFQYVSLVGGYNRIFGARNNNGKGLLNMRTVSENSGNFYLEFSGGAWNTKAFDLQKHKVILDAVNHKLYVDGNVVTSSFYIADNTEGAMWLFGTNQGGSTSNVRFFNYKLVKNSSLEQNLVPCLKLDTSIPGMYDTVSGNFYTNQGTGQFSCGKFKDYGKVNISLRVPEDYQEVEYIESPGNCYIDTLYCNTSTPYQVDCDMEITGSVSGNYWFGQQQGHGSMMYNGLYRNNSLEFNWLTVSWEANNRCKMTQKLVGSNVEITINGVKVTKAAGTNDSTGNFLIFACNNVRYYPSGLRLYSFRIHEGDKTIRNFVPCYRKSDNEIGLYDIIGKVFYENKGSGTFSKGADVYHIVSGMIPGGSSSILYGYNQLIALTAKTNNNGVTWTPNAVDGSFTLSGTATGIYSSWAEALLDNHKYFIKIQILENPNNVSISVGFLNVGSGSTSSISSGSASKIVTYTAGSGKSYGIVYPSQSVLDGIKIRLTCIDLTNWYGSGKEPATAAAFEEKFPNEYYGTSRTVIKLTELQINALPLYGYNQLFYPTVSGNWSGNSATVVFNSDGTVTATKTGTASYSGILHVSAKSSPWYAGHKYFYACEYYAETISGNGVGIGLNLYSSSGGYVYQENQFVAEKTWYRDEKIFTPSRGSSGTLYPWIFMNQREDRAAGDKVTFRNPMFIDLTDWYGAGNEPTTVAEFKQRFYKGYYPQNKANYINNYLINLLGQ